MRDALLIREMIEDGLRRGVIGRGPAWPLKAGGSCVIDLRDTVSRAPRELLVALALAADLASASRDASACRQFIIDWHIDLNRQRVSDRLLEVASKDVAAMLSDIEESSQAIAADYVVIELHEALRERDYEEALVAHDAFLSGDPQYEHLWRSET